MSSDDSRNIDDKLAEIRATLAEVARDFSDANEGGHVERLALTTALVSEALRVVGLTAVLVGGGAIEFYAPDAYVTQDIDIVVEGLPGEPVRDRIASVFEALDFIKLSGRHWERDGMLVEIPGHSIDDPYSEVMVGPYRLNIVRPEVVLIGRVVEYDQTGHTGHAAQAVVLLQAVGDTLDHSLLAQLARRERVESVLAALRALAESGTLVTDGLLRDLHDRLHSRGRYSPNVQHLEDE
jgi:hypothetical protein